MTADQTKDPDKNQPVQADVTPTPKSKWRSPATVIAILSFILSLVAIGISVRGCQISGDALDLSLRDFQAARTVVYHGVLDAAAEEIAFAAVDRNITIQAGRVYFPPQVDRTTWSITAPDFTLPLVVLETSIKDIVDRKVPREDGFLKVLDNASVPFIFESNYVAKNESFYDKSLYRLDYVAVLSDVQSRPPEITFKGISFLRRLPPETDSESFLEKVWQTTQRGVDTERGPAEQDSRRSTTH